MYLIVGLGNPEPEYSKTRHNMGFDTINKIAKEFEISVSKEKYEGLNGVGTINGEKVILLKPQTYMNLSGKCIKKYVDFYKIDWSNIIVIYDDMDVEKGEIKVRKMGGPGTHNGMRSVVSELQIEEFPRIRVGIGKADEPYEMIDYVIKPISEEEYTILDKGTDRAKEAVIEYIKNGIDSAMNKYN